nr:LysR substrate-binding domain-containing protein [Sinorhizobium mexicanum]
MAWGEIVPAGETITRNRINYVNFNQLRSFYAVARELSFTKAAELLCIGQPTVTTQVKALEETYNLQLFVRGPSDLTLTDAGEALLTVARQIFSLEERAHSLLNTVGNQFAGRLHIGTVGPFFVMKQLSKYIDRYPLMHVTVESANSDSIYQKLLNYEVDVGIIGSDYSDPRLDLVCLGKHEVVIAVPVSHPWAHRSQVNIEELDGQRLIMREKGSMTRRALEEVLAANSIRPNVVMELPRDSVLEATAAGLGLGIISNFEFSRDQRLRTLSIARYSPCTRSFAACLKERRTLPSIDAFMKMSSELVAQSLDADCSNNKS